MTKTKPIMCLNCNEHTDADHPLTQTNTWLQRRNHPRTNKKLTAIRLQCRESIMTALDQIRNLRSVEDLESTEW